MNNELIYQIALTLLPGVGDIVGKGNEKPEAVRELLKAKLPRTARVETAPSRGLFLWKVFYGEIGRGKRGGL